MREKQSVLAVDDEPKILDLLKSYLEMSGFSALCARTGKDGLRLFEEHEDSASRVSLILLDLMLPDISGENFCKKIRQVSKVPIIMLTAKADEASIISGLNLGADDYVCKPFSPRQLMARVKAALRRSGDGEKNAGLLVHKDLSVDTENRIASLGNEPLNLTRDEYNILCLLMSKPEKIFSREEILEAVKGDDFDGFDRAVDTHIKKLRSKIGDDPKTPKYISTVYGMGYRCGGAQE